MIPDATVSNSWVGFTNQGYSSAVPNRSITVTEEK
jgi:hypothetical protein